MYSIITPLDVGRLEQFANTKRAYDSFPQKKEFIIPTRTRKEVEAYLRDNKLMKDVRFISYVTGEGFNVSKALNLGVRDAKFEQIIITSPEILPLTNVLDELEPLIGQNVICQVYDQNEDLTTGISLVNTRFRSHSPCMYFLAMFNKSDIEKINGWDEAFMNGYAYEDDDFGARWNRAQIPFIVKDDIQALHQWHPRHETIQNGTDINHRQFELNNANGIIRPEKGLH